MIDNTDEFSLASADASDQGTKPVADETAAKDSPDVLLRKENGQVFYLRLLVFFVLGSAATLCSTSIYRVNRTYERDSFHTAYHGTADRIIGSFLSTLYLKYQTGRGLSTTVEYGILNNQGSAVNLTLPTKIWQESTTASRVALNIGVVGWSPLIANDEERRVFEEFSQTQSFRIGPHPQCFLCDDENQIFTNPNDLYFFSGRGYNSCKNIEIVTRTGVLPPMICDLVKARTVGDGSCQCGPIPDGITPESNILTLPEYIYKVDEREGNIPQDDNHAPYMPHWQSSVQGAPKWPGMFDQMSEPFRAVALREMMKERIPVMTGISDRQGRHYEENSGFAGRLSTTLFYPIFNENDELAAAITYDMTWFNFFSNPFPVLAELMDFVVENSCGQAYTFQVNRKTNKLEVAGEGDLHDKKFNGEMVQSTYEDFTSIVASTTNRPYRRGYELECAYRIRLYPQQSFEDEYISNRPLLFALCAAGIFLFSSMVFLVYDLTVQRRQEKAMATAKRTSDIVMSLFPENVRDRMYKQAEEERLAKEAQEPGKQAKQITSDNFKGDSHDMVSIRSTNPIADLFPSATVMFFDVCNFTVWCSERNAHQCFRLLESLYGAFDSLAKKMGVFKVETIGDSYVAVCGLPEPNETHAAVMAKFASKCLRKMKQIVRNLELSLGPSTGDLRARVGLHTGPVTAGVLRGAKGRFQLFGDTVNMCQRIESSGKPHKIHVSTSTADELAKEGYEHWLTPRDEPVFLKGKGVVNTLWCVPKGGPRSIASSMGNTDSHSHDVESSDERSLYRLIQWDTEVLYGLLEDIVACRKIQSSTADAKEVKAAEMSVLGRLDSEKVIDELTQILEMPSLDDYQQAERPEINDIVKMQLEEYVSDIAHRYRNIPFHNFAHASHVITSSAKLRERIVNLDGIDEGKGDPRRVHEMTYGISSDPMMLFAVCFAALIHDVDHTGFTNAELNSMGTMESTFYKGKSVAEQNSVDMAWKLLMEDRFEALRSCLYTNLKEFKHFRQLIVNSVMATDIADKDLKALRESRWDAAFTNKTMSETSTLGVNRKATIVFEYIIQASDICHTMQHWQTYQKFNRRLFEERYLAWLAGQLKKHPADGWYGGELWFFDNYIIPLSKKLEKCGVFGVTYDEFVTYAVENRREWVQKGKSIVEEMKKDCEAKYSKNGADGLEKPYIEMVNRGCDKKDSDQTMMINFEEDDGLNVEIEI